MRGATNRRSVRRRPVSVRASRPSRHPGLGNIRIRILVGRIMLVTALVAAGLKLVQVQGFQAAALAAQAQQQRITQINVPAQRGSITDRNGSLLAFSVDARALYAQPQRITTEWDDSAAKKEGTPNGDQHKQKIAKFIHEVLGDQAPEQAILDALRQDVTFTYLVLNVDPAKAQLINDKFPDIGAEYRAVREYPSGPVASNIVGYATWRAGDTHTRALAGLESSQNTMLAGKNGWRVADTPQGNNDVVIPGTASSQPAVPGSGLELTIDSDLQYTVQQELADYVARTGAGSGSAVVLDAHTGEVYALANNKTFDPNNFDAQVNADPGLLNNQAAPVTTPFEPGSVNKVVTAAAAIEYGVASPDTPIEVPGSITVADRQIKDWWTHDPLTLTLTGVFAKSSNVGTLLTAQKVGEDRYADMLTRFGLGQVTGVGLPGESAGRVPPRQQWSGSTFGNLPIGQGLSMTVLQLAGMYQAIANDGLRVPPRILRATIGPDGVRHVTPRPDGAVVVSPQTARTVRNMFRAVVQNPGPAAQNGTGAQAALTGYQISAKTGTAQQVDPNTGQYSYSAYWSTFAGILPADNPRFVVAIMLDNGGQSAAPLFHTLASYLAQHYQIPFSPQPSPVATLVVQQ
jgi:cell division protein FtsI (penicillin-binding protein 3)